MADGDILIWFLLTKLLFLRIRRRWTIVFIYSNLMRKNIISLERYEYNNIKNKKQSIIVYKFVSF